MLTPDFTIFNLPHILVLIILSLASSLTWFVLPKYTRLIPIVEKAIGYGLIMQIIYFYTSHFLQNSFDKSFHLPLHLCSLSIYLIILSLLLKKSNLKNFCINLTIFWSPISALVAILLPDLSINANFPSFRFIEFFWSHVLIIVGVVFILRFYNPTIKYIKMWTSFGALICTLPFIYTVNLTLNANYMYLIKRPKGGQMNFLPSEPYHVLGLILIFCLAFHLQFFLYKFVRKNQNI